VAARTAPTEAADLAELSRIAAAALPEEATEVKATVVTALARIAHQEKARHRRLFLHHLNPDQP